METEKQFKEGLSMSEANSISIAVYPRNSQYSFCWSIRVPFSKDGLMVARKFIELMESIIEEKV